ncbi:RNA-directed DNA polymerase [Exilibacterium tricleocarpae]|uniref:RNA-directed DNA polymerase n=1 Tax=Exilibacterium tricleocarpae TaxID=2591008 RepID=A0A545TZP3_9GAMM|nr:reverse transcriptase family protein [Exilibacterium tricleocarpae]TQV82684.1 RNA-directed DNA polymerase [Exilibacterium tricleocarpae]
MIQTFTRELAQCLYHSEWHFTTLLAACIQRIDNLPDDIDGFISQLLNVYNEKPALELLAGFLEQSRWVRSWFVVPARAPRFRIYNLEPVSGTTRAELPPLDSPAGLSLWLGLSPGHLDWIAGLKRVDASRPRRLDNYHYSLLRKRHTGSRLIESPKTILKAVQRRILNRILCHAPVHRAAMGFRKGCSSLDHARLHCRKRYVFCFDLENYFQSIQWLPVWRVFRTLGYPKKTANYLSALCTHACPPGALARFGLGDHYNRLLRERHLPQGAPTSPALSNAIMLGLDRRLSGLARRLELDYSRYADDLVLSGNGKRNWDFLAPLVGSICLDEGFSLNHRKTRRLTRSQSQKVVGVVVNEKINIDRRYYDDLKATLFNCVRFGPDSQNRGQHKDFCAHLLGKIHYVASVNTSKGQKLLQLFDRIAF